MATQFGQQFPRLESLRSEESLRNQALHYFRRIPDSLACARVPRLAERVYMRLESDLAMLDERNWKMFKAKLFSKHADEAPHPIRGYSSLFATLNEARGFRVLNEREYGDIQLIEESQQRSPDWRAIYNDANVVLLEVKTVLQSDYEVAFIHHNTEASKQGQPHRVRRRSPEMTDGFKNKIHSDITAAKEQMESYAQNHNLNDFHKILLIVVELDFDLSAESSSFQKANEFICSLGSDTLEVITEFVGIQWPIDKPATASA